MVGCLAVGVLNVRFSGGWLFCCQMVRCFVVEWLDIWWLNGCMFGRPPRTESLHYPGCLPCGCLRMGASATELTHTLKQGSECLELWQ